MAREPKQYEDDDGRTIVDMNVDGMPWYDRQVRRQKRQESREELKEKIARGEALTTAQTVRYTLYAILAALTVFGIVAAGACLFILILWLCWR